MPAASRASEPAPTPIPQLTSSPDAEHPSHTHAPPPSSYTLVASGVGLVTDTLRGSARLQSMLSTVQSYLPQVVADTAVKSAGQLQQLSDTYAKPIVTRVDDKISNAIVSVLAVPQRTVAYGQQKISAVDEIAFQYTPEALKPTYTATRTKTLSVVHQATERVVAFKRQRGDPLFSRLTSKLNQLSLNLAAVRQAVQQAGANAVAVAHIGERIADLQAKVGVAISAARVKGAQARALSQAALANISEAAHSLTNLVESSLTKQQAEIIHNVWSRVLETVSSVKDTLQIGTPSTTQGSSPISSRSSSSGSLNFDAVDDSVPAVNAEEVNGAAKPAAVEEVAEDAAEASSNESKHTASKGKGKKKHKHATPASKAQQTEEEKAKVADEAEE